MIVRYRTTYRDAAGEIATTIENDGNTLRMSLAGIELAGSDFDSFELVGSAPAPPRFVFAGGSLCACTLAIEIPVTVVAATGEEQALLHAELRLGAPRLDGRVDSETLSLVLAFGGIRVESAGKTGWFEGELVDLRAKLPPGCYLKTCFSCGLSDYSPYGHGSFGSLACFRDNKQGYRAVSTKSDLFRVWDTMTEFVQETHVCPEFELRKPGSGYRG